MKNTTWILLYICLAISLISCKKDDAKNVDFYDTVYRIGLWINNVESDRKDTLHFINDSNLIRKGDFWVYEEYLYRIEGEKLFIRLPGNTTETQHPVTVVDKKIVVLGNMYFTTGGDNYGTFRKVD